MRLKEKIQVTIILSFVTLLIYMSETGFNKIIELYK